MTVENIAASDQGSASWPTSMAPEDIKHLVMSLLGNPIFLMGFAAALIIFVFVYYVIHSGIFASIEVDTREPKTGRMVVGYKTGRGAYKNAGELFTDAVSILPKRNCIGIYYDDPEAVPENELRYAVGVILAKDGKDLDQDEADEVLKHGFKLVHLPEPKFAVMSSFPFTTTLSIYLAIFRVYPKLKNYIATSPRTAFALILQSKSTRRAQSFMMPLSKQEEFFVPEFQEEVESIATTEFSNHPDHASVEDDLRKAEKKDEVFVKPAKPAPKRAAKSKSVSPDDSNDGSPASLVDDEENEDQD